MRRDKPLLIGWNRTAGVMVDMYRGSHPHLLPPGRYPGLDALADRSHAMSAFQRARREDISGAPSKAEPHLAAGSERAPT